MGHISKNCPEDLSLSSTKVQGSLYMNSTKKVDPDTSKIKGMFWVSGMATIVFDMNILRYKRQARV